MVNATSKEFTEPVVVAIKSRPRRQRNPLPENYSSSVHALTGIVTRDASILIDIEDRRTILFRVNSIQAYLLEFEKLGVDATAYQAACSMLEPLIAQYHSWCPALSYAQFSGQCSCADVWLPLTKVNAVKELLLRLQRCVHWMSSAVDH